MLGSVTILGCGSAIPTFRNSPSGQILNLCDKAFLIDCGEGVQLTIRRMGLKTARLYNVFISHLHGDHCFGLIGLISTLGMMSRTQPLHIYAPADLERLMQPWLDYYCKGLSFEVLFHPINPRKQEVIYKDRTVSVTTIPLKHTVPCCGFLFTEHHRRLNENNEFYIEARKRYAYCSDTMYTEKIIPIIEGVDTLFHEATYPDEYADRCPGTMHSTAREAGRIARKARVGQLMIGHYSARVDDHTVFLNQAKEEFENTILAVEQQTYSV